MSDSGVEVFEADVAENPGTSMGHDADPASHVPVADVLLYQRGLLLLRIVPAKGDPGMPVVVHDVVDDPSAHTIRSDAGDPEAADMLMRLVCAPSCVILAPPCIIVTSDVCHGESVDDRTLCH